MARVTFDGSRGKQSGGRVKYRWLDEALNATPKPQRTGRRPADPRAPVSWQRNNTRAGMGRDEKDDLTWYRQNQEQNVQDRLQAQRVNLNPASRSGYANPATSMTESEWLARRAVWSRLYGNIFQTEAERTARQSWAPVGYVSTPYAGWKPVAYGGSTGGYKNTPPAYGSYPTTGSGGGGYGYTDYGGGGGGGGTTNKNNLFSDLMTWKIK